MITLKTQGSFAIGGTTVTHEGEFSMEHFLAPQGQKAYGDHAYVFYQIPANNRKYPIIFQHGGAQSKRTWKAHRTAETVFKIYFCEKVTVYI